MHEKVQKMQSCRNVAFGKGRAFGPLSPHPGGLGSEEEGILPGGGGGGQLRVLQLLAAGRLTSLHHTWLYFRDQ